VMYGRNSESPVPVVAAGSPSRFFHPAGVAGAGAPQDRPARDFLPPPPARAALPDLTPTHATAPNAGDEFLPSLRDEQTLARPWALPGTPGLEHRIGGLEKADRTGHISYAPEKRARMTRRRAQKVAGIAGAIPELEVDDPDGEAKVLILSWGGPYGPVAAAARRV